MKTFFTKNRRLVEIILTLLLVFLTAGYYYLIYIPARENEIVERRFRTLQRIEKNMQEKFQGYMSTIKNCISRADESFFNGIVKGYNADVDKFWISVLKNEVIPKDSIRKHKYDTVMASLIDSAVVSFDVKSSANGKKITINYNWYKLDADSNLKHVAGDAKIDYRAFIVPLLRNNVFDHYLVFNVCGDSSSMIYEDFPSGISFNSIDSLFDAKEKVYSSRIIRIETGGEKYLAFLHPCGYNRKNDRIIAGLLKEEMFNKEKRQLPEKMVTPILFIALFAILLLPVIRLMLMGKKERIRLFDLFASYFSLLLLIPLLILIFFWNKQRFVPNTLCRQDPKKVLANQISRSLFNEIDTAYTLLNKIDSLYANNGDLKILDTINIEHLNYKKDSSETIHTLINEGNRNKDSFINDAVNKLDVILSRDKEKYSNTQVVFWMDSATGKEIANWAFDKNPPPGIYKERIYFKNARDNKVISLDDYNFKNFAIEPVVSRTDGKFKVVIAKKSFKTGCIVASASRFGSVTNPVLPMGFGFSITDAEGNTIFDIDTTNNLNENLLEEFTSPASFKAALDTKTAREFKTRYEGKEYTVLAQPIKGLPYFIVISENGSFESSLNTQCFSFTMVMLFSFFLFLCVELIIVLKCHSRETKLLKNKFDLSWIYPRESMSQRYFFLFVFNSAMLFLLGLFCFIGFSIQKITEYIFLFAIAALLSTIAACVSRLQQKDSVARREIPGVKNKSAIKALTILASAILIISAFYSARIFLITALFSAMSIVLFGMLPKNIGNVKNADYRRYYQRMIFSKILLTSGIPVVIFYMCIYNFELRLQERLKLLDYAEKLEGHTKSNEELQSVLKQFNDANSIKRFYIDSTWIADLGPKTVSDSGESNKYSNADGTSINLLKTSRIRYNDVSGTTENFEILKPFASDQFTFNSIFSDTGNILTYHVTKMAEKKPIDNVVSLSSTTENVWKTPCNFQQEWIFLLMLFIALLFCYQILKYVINKVFGKNIPNTEDFKIMHKNLIADEKIKWLFVQAVPGIDQASFIEDQLKKNDDEKKKNEKGEDIKYNTAIIDFNKIPAADKVIIGTENEDKQNIKIKEDDNWYSNVAILENENINCIVLTHFEYNLLNENATNIKLQLLEKFVYAGSKKIIICSSLNHTEFINSLQKTGCASPGNADQKKTGKETPGQGETYTSCSEYINRWSNLLGRFTDLYIDGNFSADLLDKQQPTSTKFVEEELCLPVFLNNYKEQFKLVDKENKTEDNILLIQSLSEQPYREIWNSLTHEEQLILYDLAEDGLVNTSNFMPLSHLLNKGLIIEKDSVLMLMNSSFRNYILSAVNFGEIKTIEKEVNDGQTWEDYKYPLLIILGALVYFVLSSNPEKFGNVLPVVSGVMAGIPTIIKILSYLKPSQNKI